MTNVNQTTIYQFVEKHSVTEDQQIKALVEEVGELAEKYNTDSSDAEVAEELADVIFVARTLAELRDINISEEVNKVADENLKKNSETDGQKVTKSSVEVMD